MKTLIFLALTAALLAMSGWTAAAQQSSPVEPKVASDGAGATFTRVDNMHKSRFIEIVLAHRDAKTGKPVAECSNTMFTPRGIPVSKDTAPQARVEGLDLGTPVVETIGAEAKSRFTGRIPKVTVELK